MLSGTSTKTTLFHTHIVDLWQHLLNLINWNLSEIIQACGIGCCEEIKQSIKYINTEKIYIINIEKYKNKCTIFLPERSWTTTLRQGLWAEVSWSGEKETTDPPTFSNLAHACGHSSWNPKAGFEYLSNSCNESKKIHCITWCSDHSIYIRPINK